MGGGGNIYLRLGLNQRFARLVLHARAPIVEQVDDRKQQRKCDRDAKDRVERDLVWAVREWRRKTKTQNKQSIKQRLMGMAYETCRVLNPERPLHRAYTRTEATALTLAPLLMDANQFFSSTKQRMPEKMTSTAKETSTHGFGWPAVRTRHRMTPPIIRKRMPKYCECTPNPYAARSKRCTDKLIFLGMINNYQCRSRRGT
jgi:hypothetical protein